MKTPAKPTPHLDAPAFRSLLLAWYDAHARELPWRRDRDPYRVWVSEIMLQQTRVAAVIEHYHAFLRRFPTVEKLAAARESSVLAEWSGLGYYRRARMLHAAAKVVARERKGKFPETAAQWVDLPGIGRYTSAAIASIAFGEPVAVVDGNVERVLQRVSGKSLSIAQIWDAAEQLLDRDSPGDFNQAMMELGATVCTPRSPACLMCPLIDLCATRGEMASLAKPAKQNKREIHFVLCLRNGVGRGAEVLMVQRPRDASLMAGMWELPEIAASDVGAGKQQIPPARVASRRNDKGRDKGSQGASSELCFTLKHSITVTDYTVRVWRESPPRTAVKNHVEWISHARLPKLPLTGLARKILRKCGLLNSSSGRSMRL
ncbi:MAG TPA: A/G-specific adenine glycosylase [Candidatus Sulfotelmatobacter sp.]|nr:A/G-specific adenine glycosylase [Candidatus Sulfotelmatobacter sp.]